MNGCDFCAIASGAVDRDLATFASDRVFVIPALRQRRRNRGHALVLPVAHVGNLHDADGDLLAEIVAITARLTGAFPALYGATGSFVFQNNFDEPAEPSFHLHVHALPRFDDDDFKTPDPQVGEVPRAERLGQADRMRQLLGGVALGRQVPAPDRQDRHL